MTAPGPDVTSESDGLEVLQQRADDLVEMVTDEVAHAEANVTATRTRHGLTRFANSTVHQHVGEDTARVHLVVAVDGRTATAATGDLDPDALRATVRRALDSARVQPPDPSWPGATPRSRPVATATRDAATVHVTPEERTDAVRAFVEAAPDLRAAGFCDTATSDAAFASTAGQRVAGSATRATLDGIHQTATSAGSAHATSVALRDLDGAALGARAADLARRSADTVDLEPGDYEVVLGPEAVATLVTFLAVYGFNAKMHHEGASGVTLGSAQFDPHVTLTAAPDDPRAVGLRFDAEGSPRSRHVLIEGGVASGLAHDRRTAGRAGATTTGDALPGGEGFGAVPGTLALSPGDRSPASMVGDVTRGLLITQLNYNRVLDPKSLAVTGLTRNGTFLIEDGEVVGAVGNLRHTQSFLAALAPGQVLGVGADDRYAMGEFGEGMTIVPSLRLASWHVTGGVAG